MVSLLSFHVVGSLEVQVNDVLTHHPFFLAAAAAVVVVVVVVAAVAAAAAAAVADSVDCVILFHVYDRST